MKEALIVNEHNNREAYQSDFDRVAKVLLNRTELKIKKNSYRIREIEFYYYSVNHTDYFCHKKERQLKNQSLYFHRFNYESSKNYFNLKRKGIDITLGNEQKKGSEKEIYAGILIRAIENLETNDVITGIGNLTTQIIRDISGLAEPDGINLIRKLYDEDKNIFDPTGMIYLKTSQENSLKIFKKQRQGLGSEEGDTDDFYLDAKYNYFTYPEIEVLK